MKIAFRVDASLEMGTGHIMRCLTLAEALRAEGAHCHFICREQPGHLFDMIQQQGFELTKLPLESDGSMLSINTAPALPTHALWLGCDWQVDAKQTRSVLEVSKCNWLVVDHYSLDARWEQALSGCYQNLMVIDDLADRKHVCNLLLDQTFGREEKDYQSLIPKNCRVLLGSKYALLRPEFAEWREYSLKRRTIPRLQSILITLGGTDPSDITSQVLRAIKNCDLPLDLKITVVMGITAPHFEKVRDIVKCMPNNIDILVNVTNMAEIMANSDLAIGAAGATSWERCALGLPSILLVDGENQKTIASQLGKEKIAIIINSLSSLNNEICHAIKGVQLDVSMLNMLSQRSLLLTDGTGSLKVSAVIQMESKK